MRSAFAYDRPGLFQRHAPDAELFVTGELSTKSLQRELAKTDCAVYVANTAFPSGGPHSVVDELNVNVDTALTYFETLSRLDPAPTIIYISSGGTVYGNTEHSDTVSETQRLAPTSTYGVGKVLIEESLRFLCRTTRIRGRILRLSNTVGEWNRRMDQGLVPLTIRCLLNGEPLTVFGDMEKVRDYVDSDDVCNAVYRAARWQGDDRCPVWNIGSGRGVSIRDVIHTVEIAAQRRVKIESKAARVMDVQKIVLNVEKAQKELGWIPSVDFDQSVKRLWEHFANDSSLTSK